MKQGRAGLDVEVRRFGPIRVVRVRGDVDLSTSPTLLSAAMKSLGDTTTSLMIINLAGVDYLDSSGVATLIEVLREARRRSTRLRLAGLQQGPREVLQLTRLLDLFDVRRSEEEALQS